MMMTPDKKNKMSGVSEKDAKVAAFVFLFTCFLATPAMALEALSNDQLAGINGRDGVSLTLNTSELSAHAIGMRVNVADTNKRAGLEMQNVTYTPVDIDGNATNAYQASLTVGLDVGQKSGYPAPVLSLDLPNRIRFYTDNIKLFNNAGSSNQSSSAVGSLGELSYDAQGKLVLTNIGGFFHAGTINGGNNGGMLYGELTDGTLLWRQNAGNPEAPYLVMTDGNTMWHSYNATLGVTADGLYQAADAIDLRFVYTTRFKQPLSGNTDSRMSLTNGGGSAPNYDPTGIGMFRFGWAGTIMDPVLTFGGGGLDGANGGSSTEDGMHMDLKWNFLNDNGYSSVSINGVNGVQNSSPDIDPGTMDPDDTMKHSAFRWVLGNEAAVGEVNPPRFELSNWRNLPGADYGSVMDFRLGLVNSGGTGAGTLCFGATTTTSGGCSDTTVGQVVGTAPSGTGLGLAIRNSSIRAYSEGIRAYAPAFSGTSNDCGTGEPCHDFDWGLIFTMAHLDGNVYIYPQGNPYTGASYDVSKGETQGLTADIVVMSQTLDDDNGSFRHSTGLTDARVDSNGNRASNFGKGNQLLIADTGAGNAIGTFDQSLLLIAQKTHINMKPMGAADANGVYSAEAAYQGGIDLTSSKARLNLFATFGGIDLPPAGQANPYDYYPAFGEACPSGKTCPAQLTGGVNAWNYEGFMNLRLSPHASDNTDPTTRYLGYSLAMRATSNGVLMSDGSTYAPAYGYDDSGAFTVFAGQACASGNGGQCSGQGTYFSTAEPHQQDAVVSLGGVTGDMAFVNGKLSITNGDGTNADRPALSMSHDILVGLSAGNEMNARSQVLGSADQINDSQVFMINRMDFNGQNLGSIAVPRGNFYGTLALKPQRL